jgi:hypothetical protein
MDEQTSNDNDADRVPSKRREPDAHGQAAMLLFESLIHGLIARSVISVVEAVEIVETAAEVKLEVAELWGDSHATMQQSLGLLEAISASLKLDI